jgi:hypothetical protein
MRTSIVPKRQKKVQWNNSGRDFSLLASGSLLLLESQQSWGIVDEFPKRFLWFPPFGFFAEASQTKAVSEHFYRGV